VNSENNYYLMTEQYVKLKMTKITETCDMYYLVCKKGKGGRRRGRRGRNMIRINKKIVFY